MPPQAGQLFRAVRGYTVVAALCDEIAFWPVDTDAANPDTEILAALKPAMATIPTAMLICMSSPYAKKGSLGRGGPGPDSPMGQSEERKLGTPVRTRRKGKVAGSGRAGGCPAEEGPREGDRRPAKTGQRHRSCCSAARGEGGEAERQGGG